MKTLIGGTVDLLALHLLEDLVVVRMLVSSGNPHRTVHVCRSGLRGLPVVLQLSLQNLLLLDFLVPVDLAPQLICENDLPLHLQTTYFLLHLQVLPFDRVVLPA